MELEGFEAWLRGYFDAILSNDPGEVADLFAEDAEYWVNPFEGPRWRGRDEVVRAWTARPLANVQYRYETLAVVGDIGIAHWNVLHDHPEARGTRVELDGILVITFDGDGRCVEHREWVVERELPAP